MPIECLIQNSGTEAAQILPVLNSKEIGGGGALLVWVVMISIVVSNSRADSWNTQHLLHLQKTPCLEEKYKMRPVSLVNGKPKFLASFSCFSSLVSSVSWFYIWRGEIYQVGCDITQVKWSDGWWQYKGMWLSWAGTCGFAQSEVNVSMVICVALAWRTVGLKVLVLGGKKINWKAHISVGPSWHLSIRCRLGGFYGRATPVTQNEFPICLLMF